MEIKLSIKLLSYSPALQHSVSVKNNSPSPLTNRNDFECSQHSKGNVSLFVLERESCACALVCVFAHAYAYGTNTLPHEINKTTRRLSANNRRGHRRGW